MMNSLSVGPNWLLVLAAAYAFTAFFFLAFAGIQISGRSERLFGVGRQKAACIFAALSGMAAFALQGLGQFMHLGEGEPMVLLTLTLIPLLVGFVWMSDNEHRIAGNGAASNAGSQSEAVALFAQRHGEAAE